MGLLFIIVGVLIYFLPSIIGRNHKQLSSILALNLLLGWTFVGWVIALVWAVFKTD
jgi:hypothetical protein